MRLSAINLLPWREERRAQELFDFGVDLLIGLSAVLIIGISIHVVLSGEVDNHKERNGYLSAEMAKVDKKIAAISRLKTTKQRLIDRMDVIQTLQASRPGVVKLFNQIAQVTPDGIYINELKQVGKDIEIHGSSESNGQVSTYMRSIHKASEIGKPRLKFIKNSDEIGPSSFVVYAKQLEAER